MFLMQSIQYSRMKISGSFVNTETYIVIVRVIKNYVLHQSRVIMFKSQAILGFCTDYSKHT